MELLLRTVLSHQSDPILIADNDALLLGRQFRRRQATGTFEEQDDRSIHRRSCSQPNKVHYTAMNDVLPGRHVLVLHDDSGQKNAGAEGQDYAFLSLDADGRIVAWHAGAERVYGYTSEEIIGQHASCLYA